MTVVTPTGLPNDGSVDISRKLLHILWDAGSQGNIVDFTAVGGVLRCDRTLIFNRSLAAPEVHWGDTVVRCTADGTGINGTLLQWPGQEIMWPRYKPLVSFNARTGTRWYDGHFDGPAKLTAPVGAFPTHPWPDYRPDLEAGAGIDVNGCHDFRWANPRVTDASGDGIHVWGGSTDVTITGPELVRCRRQAVVVENASRVYIGQDDTTLGGGRRAVAGFMGRSVFDLEPAADDWATDDVTLNGWDVYTSMGKLYASGGRATIGNVTVTDIRLWAQPVQIEVAAAAPRLDTGEVVRRGPFTFTDIKAASPAFQVTYGSPVSPLTFTNVDGLTLARITQPIQRTQQVAGIYMKDCTDVTVDPSVKFPIR